MSNDQIPPQRPIAFIGGSVAVSASLSQMYGQIKETTAEPPQPKWSNRFTRQASMSFYSLGNALLLSAQIQARHAPQRDVPTMLREGLTTLRTHLYQAAAHAKEKLTLPQAIAMEEQAMSFENLLNISSEQTLEEGVEYIALGGKRQMQLAMKELLGASTAAAEYNMPELQEDLNEAVLILDKRFRNEHAYSPLEQLQTEAQTQSASIR